MFLRKVQIILSPSDRPEEKVVFEKHSIDFEVRSVLGWGGDTATVSIRNLAVEEIKSLQRRRKDSLLFIEIRAGYADDLYVGGLVSRNKSGDNIRSDDSGGPRVTISSEVVPTIFSGIVTNTIGYKKAPDSITTMFCVSKATYNATKKQQINTIPAGSTLRNAIKSMCNDYGYNIISTYGVSEEVLETVLPRGRVFQDTFSREFTQLLSEYNLKSRIATAEVQVFSETYGTQDAVAAMAQNRKTVPIEPRSVIGTPVAGIGVFDVTVFLRADIQPGIIVDVSPILGPELLANGVTNTVESQGLFFDSSLFRYTMQSIYLVESIVVVGQTHGNIFQTSVHGVYSGGASASLTDKNWQSWYATTGMAEEGGL